MVARNGTVSGVEVQGASNYIRSLAENFGSSAAMVSKRAWFRVLFELIKILVGPGPNFFN